MYKKDVGWPNKVWKQERLAEYLVCVISIMFYSDLFYTLESLLYYSKATNEKKILLGKPDEAVI